MQDEEAFLAAIGEQPEDDDVRLIYADWLEERGEERAEYLRVEHGVRLRGAQGQERLRDLRLRLSADWLRAVHDGRLGPDWSIVLQSAGVDSRSVVVRRISEIAGLSAAEAERAVRSCPAELKGSLRYWQAHRLRESVGDLAHVTVEFRPATS